jgi:hypothetical protein
MKKMIPWINKLIGFLFLLLGGLLFASNFFNLIKNENLKTYSIICILYGIWRIYKTKK